MRASHTLRACAGAAVLGITIGATQALGATVGTTGAVNPSSTGTPPGGNSRTLKIGSDVVFKERIQTTSGGSLQVLFVDKTTLSIGPNSDMTIDEFVYNPDVGTGTFVASIAKGSFRFVGGRISRSSGATINLPSATIGIRGTIVTGEVGAWGFKISNLQGHIEVTLPGGGGTMPVLQGEKVTFQVETGATETSPITASDFKVLPAETTTEPAAATEPTVAEPPAVATPFVLPVEVEDFSQDAEPVSPTPGLGEEPEPPPPPPPPPPP